jgi:hypothetical protein
VGYFAMPNYIRSELVFDVSAFGNADAPLRIKNQELSPRAAADRAVDFALRDVPLPEGLMKRLASLSLNMPEETAGQ